jgi:NAD(P)-dependent dehydrogenase (short-subunit alcohol dehydrogenase family)
MGRVSGKVAIVTGAASGIGAATAEVLAREGARVVVADLDGDAARRQAHRIVEAGGEAIAHAFDLGDESSIERLVRQTLDTFGRVDVLHNNAAATHLAATADSPLALLAAAVWDDTFRINVRGTALMIKNVVPHMIEQRAGSIINTSSLAGMSGDLGHPAYGASKAAINVLTQYAATEFGKDGIRVNAVAPGLITTRASEESGHGGSMSEVMLANHLTPRLGTPADVANAVLYLASDESGFVTGQVLCVDGGLGAHAPYVSELRELLGR